MHNLKAAFRSLVKSPGFTLVAVLTLALGIGANTAIYSVLDAVLLRPLPYPEPDRLMMVSELRADGGQNSVAGGAYLDWRAHQTTFDALTMTTSVSYNLRGEVALRLQISDSSVQKHLAKAVKHVMQRLRGCQAGSLE